MWFTTALANLSLWSQGPVTAHPHTHTHTYPHKHIHRGSYCHGNQPLYDYSLLRRRIGTNLSQPLAFFIVRFSLSSLVVAAISSQPTSSPGLIPCFLVSSFHLFPSSPPTCFWQSWVWFAGCPLKHGGVWRDFLWVTHCFLWTCSRQVIFY